MQVFLLRHGTRNFTMGDVPLNEEGCEQALSLAKNSRFSRVKNLLSSPKARAKQTLTPLANKYKLTIDLYEDLDQMSSDESESGFVSRVRAFIKRIESGEWGDSLILCTHSDWLSIAMQVIPSDALDLKHHMFSCAEVMEFEVKDELWIIK